MLSCRYQEVKVEVKEEVKEKMEVKKVYSDVGLKCLERTKYCEAKRKRLKVEVTD